RRGLRVVDEEGQPVSLDQVPQDGFLTVFPEGHEGAADAQALLIHVRPGSLRLPPGRMGRGAPGTPPSPPPPRACGRGRRDQSRSSARPPAPCPSCPWASTSSGCSSPRATSPN